MLFILSLTQAASPIVLINYNWVIRLYVESITKTTRGLISVNLREVDVHSESGIRLGSRRFFFVLTYRRRL